MSTQLTQKYVNLGDSHNQFSIRAASDNEAYLLSVHEQSNGLVATESAVVLKDSISHKERLVYAVQPAAAEFDGQQAAGEYKAALLGHNEIIPQDKEALSALGIDAARLKTGLAADDDFATFASRAKEALTQDNIAALMAYSQYESRRDVARDNTSAPDAREQLKGHFELERLLGANQEMASENIAEIISNAEQMESARRAGVIEDDPNAYANAIAEEKKLNALRSTMLQGSLAQENFLVVDDKLLNAEQAESYTSNKYAGLEAGKVMSLGDTNSQFLAGKPSDETLSHLSKSLVDEQLMGAITIREKGLVEDKIETTMFIVKDSNDQLWMRAQQGYDNGFVINENKAAFDALGIDSNTLLQGVYDRDKHTAQEDVPALQQKGIDTMMAQISPNHIRKMISAVQIAQNHQQAHSNEIGIDVPTPRSPDSENLAQAIVTSQYRIQKLSSEQLETFKQYGNDTDRPIAASDNIKQAFSIKDNEGGHTILAQVDRYFLDFPDKDGSGIFYQSFKNGHAESSIDYNLLGADLNESAELTADNIRQGIENSTYVISPDIDKLDHPAVRGFGVPGEVHPAIASTVEPAVKASVSQEEMPEPTNNNRRGNRM